MNETWDLQIVAEERIIFDNGKSRFFSGMIARLQKDLGGYFMVDKVRAEIRKALAALDAREPSPDVPDFLQDL